MSDLSRVSVTDVYWFKEGENDSVAIECDEKYEVVTRDDSHYLEIYDVTEADYGQYLCLAKSDATSSHWLFGLQVEGEEFIKTSYN